MNELENIDFLYKLRDSWNFFIDDQISFCSEYSPKNIAILLESKFISPGSYSNFIINWKSVVEKFSFVFTNDKNLLHLHPKIKWCPPSFIWIKNPKIHDKTKLVSMIF